MFYRGDFNRIDNVSFRGLDSDIEATNTEGLIVNNTTHVNSGNAITAENVSNSNFTNNVMIDAIKLNAQELVEFNSINGKPEDLTKVNEILSKTSCLTSIKKEIKAAFPEIVAKFFLGLIQM
ncbi:hypothetical protein [Periweissella fabalis]|uniref:Uncharacterized protein n=1 Tax=Periweissella fabalis TaxID=1070421 RepID=A0A7X6N6L6_9LACO|nr:hypothetical protein [Periweissella fabalis]MCM0598392.1 hypothetical protein [Periweissella fabalis]NKZ24998.1 hypothetical protein [Periweissella fabalis]